MTTSILEFLQSMPLLSSDISIVRSSIYSIFTLKHILALAVLKGEGEKSATFHL